MRLAAAVLALASALSGAWALAARAGIADPVLSSVPARVFLCPAGDSVFVVIPRELSQEPWDESDVWVGFCDCPAVRLSRANAVGYAVDSADCVATVPPPADAVYRFPIAGGGLCPGARARTWAGGVLLAHDTVVVSPDQDGNLLVNELDVEAVRSKLGTADAGADLDDDGVVTESDVDLVMAHLGHESSDREVPVLPTTWGRLKLIYR